jgi:ubiquinone/menaquinone biosynthesis C-methylase UbiE
MNTQAAAIRRYFDDASDQYARSRAQEYSFMAQKRITLDFLPARSARVLDIGCGPAVLAEELLERADEYCGIDLSPQMIAHGAARMQGDPRGSRCTLSVGDAEALAFADGSFDAVVALGLLEYLPSYERALREMCRVLRPGGVVVLALPNRASAYRRCRLLADRARRTVKRLLGRAPCGTEHFHWNPCIPARLDEELRRAGFVRAAGRYCNFIFYPLHDWHARASLALNRTLSRIAPAALRPWLGAQYVVKARKP